MKLTPIIIESFAKFVSGGREWAAMKQLVADIDHKGWTGAEKRRVVLSGFNAIGYGLALWAGNLLLELAVAWVKEVTADA